MYRTMDFWLRYYGLSPSDIIASEVYRKIPGLFAGRSGHVPSAMDQATATLPRARVDWDRYLGEPEPVCAIAHVLKIPREAVPLSKPGRGQEFPCLLHNGQHKARLLWGGDGLITYWDGDGTLRPIAFASLYCALKVKAGKVRRRWEWTAPEFATWALRLFIEAGVLDPVHVDLPPLPSDAAESVQKVYAGIKLLFQCKWTYEPGPTAFTREFAATWCGVSKDEATYAIRRLLYLDIIYPVEESLKGKYGKKIRLYLPGPDPNGKR